MQAWLAKNMPDAELTACAAHTVMQPQGIGEYLTDYESGYIRTGEKNTGFMINTVTKAVCFNTDPAEYDLDAIKQQLKEEHGMQFGSLLIVG